MNSVVHKTIAILLKEKGFQELCYCYYNKDGLQTPYLENGSSSDVDFRVELEDLLEQHNNPYHNTYSAPTIAEVIMWLHKKHSIWIWVEKTDSRTLFNWVATWHDGLCENEARGKGYTSPTEAYSAAITDCLVSRI